MAVGIRIFSLLCSTLLLTQLMACRQEKAKATEIKEQFSQDLQTGSRVEDTAPAPQGGALFVEKSCEMCHTNSESSGSKISLKGASMAELAAAKSKDAHKALAKTWPSEQELAEIAAYLK